MLRPLVILAVTLLAALMAGCSTMEISNPFTNDPLTGGVDTGTSQLLGVPTPAGMQRFPTHGYQTAGAGGAQGLEIFRGDADMGFVAIYVTGAGVTNMWFGLPDQGFMGLTDIADHTARIRDAVEVPLIVDADTGFGNALNTYHAVRTLERAGADCIQLEDQVSPKRCGHFNGKEVIEASEMIGKIKAACDARRNEGTIIMARTDAAAIHGFDAAVERAQAYAEAGADLLFVEAVTSAEHIAALPQRLKTPQLMNMVIGGKTPITSTEDVI